MVKQDPKRGKTIGKGRGGGGAPVESAFEKKRAKPVLEEVDEGRSSAFVDRRIGQDGDSAEEERMIARAQRERLALAMRKRSRFAVEDDDGAEESLTHGGVSLKELPAFEKDTFFDSDDEKMDGDTVMDYHFGGGEDQDPERRKTKQEVMAEIIAKSKMYKAEKRKEKDERDEDLEKLNSGFADISALLAANERPPRERVSRKEAKEAAPIDDFDQLARDLMDDMKAQASSRLKTPEEVAQEERDALVELERKRLKRMKDDIDEDGEEGAKPARKKGRVSFSDAPEGDEAEGASSKKSKRGKNEEEEEEEDSVATQHDDLPYTFEMPTKGSGLSKLLEGQSGERQDIILLRLITCHAIALSPNNRSKLEGLVRLLLDRMGAVASAPKVDMDSLDSAVKAVQMLCSKMPEFTIQELPAQMVEIAEALSLGIEGGTARWPDGRELLLLKTLSIVFPVTDFTHKIMTPWFCLLSRLLVQCPVRSSRDAAAALFVCSILQEAGSAAQRVFPEVPAFLSTILAAFLPQSSASKLGSMHPARAFLVSWTFGDDAGRSAGWLSLGKQQQQQQQRSDGRKNSGKGKKGQGKGGEAASREWTGDDVLLAALQISCEFVRSMRSQSADYRLGGGLLLTHLHEAVGLLSAQKLPSDIAGAAKALKEELEQVRQGAESHRDSLTMFKAPAIAIRQFNPRFSNSFDPNRDMDPDRERAERVKIKRQTRKELKGTVREIRNDNFFSEHHRAQKLKTQRQIRDQKGKAIEKFFQEAQFEAKIGSGGKKKKK